MRASEFVKRLRELAPAQDALQRSGLTQVEAMEFIRSFEFTKRPDIDGVDADPFVDLLTKWEGRHVEIGAIRFVQMPRQHQAGVQIAEIETDPVIIDGRTKQIVVEEAQSAGHVLWLAALDSEHFMDALLHAAEFLSARATGSIDFEDLDAAQKAAADVALFAGGAKYEQFYSMLFGV